jgi:hypothetical protein
VLVMARSFAPEPRVIDFGAVTPGDARKFVLLVASSAANVTARVDGGGGRFRVESVACQAVSERRLTPEEIAQLPPNLRNDPRYWVEVVREITGTSDGVAPLAVEYENEVVVNVVYRAEDVAGQGVHSATIVILGTGWNPISVPASALVAQAAAEVPNATQTVAQGGVAALSVPIRSLFGPDTEVRLELEPGSGLAMNPVTVSLPRGGRAQALLRIEAPRDAQVISLRCDVRSSAFGGRQVNFLPISFQIVPAPPNQPADGRFCAVPDRPMSDLQIRAYGSPGGRWTRGNLSFRVTNSPPGMAVAQVAAIVGGAFQQYAAATPFFQFTDLTSSGASTNADVTISFGGQGLDTHFGAAGGVAGAGKYPPQGQLFLDVNENWTANNLLLRVCLHEIGHVLGLSHSTSPNSMMYPFTTNLTALDAETIRAIRDLYNWRPQVPLPGTGGSSAGPALAMIGTSDLSGSSYRLAMAWKGPGDSSLHWGALDGGGLTPRGRIPGVGASHGPALTSRHLTSGGGGFTLGALMAWKGAGSDSGIYYAPNLNLDGWTAQERVADVGTSARPALAEFDGRIWMVWKGARDDSNIYYSRFDGSRWEAQEAVYGIRTSAGPALAVVGNRLFMSWKGAGDDPHIYFTFIGPGASAIWDRQNVVGFSDVRTTGRDFIPAGTTDGPALAPRGSDLVMAWKGVEGDSGIYFSILTDRDWSGQVRIPNVGTSAGPAIANLGGQLFLSWKGAQDDTGLYFSTLG